MSMKNFRDTIGESNPRPSGLQHSAPPRADQNCRHVVCEVLGFLLVCCTVIRRHETMVVRICRLLTTCDLVSIKK